MDEAPEVLRSELLKARARSLGFSLVGIAPATDADSFAHFTTWLDQGYAGEMAYLHRQRTERQHPRSVLAPVRSVLMVGLEYRDHGTRNENESLDTRTDALPVPQSRGRIAAYAQGPDYHRYIWDLLNDLAAWLEAEVADCCAKAVSDTAPLLERDFARRAGLGWVGKNTMLINPRRGSFFFLGALLTDLVLAPDKPFATNHCGTCTACLDACPTDAFVKPQVLDASKCISYLTIELRSPIPHHFREPMGEWMYGCDVCQDVCPWNRKALGAPLSFPHDPELESLDPLELLALDEDAFRMRFKKTSLWRNRRGGLLRNAAIVLGNVGDELAIPALERALAENDEVLREAAEWAIGRIRQRSNNFETGTSTTTIAEPSL